METTVEKIMAGNEAYRNIVERTSVRKFTEQPVSADLQTAVLYAGMSAPSGVNRQPWEFILIDDPEVLRQLADGLPYAKMASQAPMAIAVCGNSDRFLEGDDATLWVQDLGAASENILLAAHALGLGGVWTALYPHADRMETTRRILNLPANIIPYNLIPIGYPASHHAPMDKWHPERIHRNGFEAQ